MFRFWMVGLAACILMYVGCVAQAQTQTDRGETNDQLLRADTKAKRARHIADMAYYGSVEVVSHTVRGDTLNILCKPRNEGLRGLTIKLFFYLPRTKRFIEIPNFKSMYKQRMFVNYPPELPHDELFLYCFGRHELYETGAIHNRYICALNPLKRR